MNLNYRKASIDDIPLLIDLEKKVQGVRTYSGTFKVNEWIEELNIGVVYIIEKDGVPVGDIMFEMKSAEHAYVDKILVVPEFQGQGIARHAMKYVLSEIGNIQRIDLVAHPENIQALSLYESFGFKVESRKENYFGDGEPRLVMFLVKDVV